MTMKFMSVRMKKINIYISQGKNSMSKKEREGERTDIRREGEKKEERMAGRQENLP